MAFLGGKVLVHSKFASTGTTMSRRFSSQAAPTPSPLACFKFRFVSSPQQALERLAKIPRPRVILLDLMMPRMDGWEFLRRQSADPSIASIPTIVLSGSELPTGAKHQLSKPVDVDRLRAVVDQYC
jgi:CheY-like chemotaxis protein